MNDPASSKMIGAYFALLCCTSTAIAEPPLSLHCTASGSFGWSIKYDILVDFDQSTATVEQHSANFPESRPVTYRPPEVKITQSSIAITNRRCFVENNRGQCEDYETTTYLIDRMDGSFTQTRADSCNGPACGTSSWSGSCAVATQKKF